MAIDFSYPTYRTVIEATLRSVLSEIRCTGSMSQASLDWVTSVAPYLGRERLAELQAALKSAPVATAGSGRRAISVAHGRIAYTHGGAIVNPSMI